MTGARPKAREAVALYGGSFDPIHAGHLAVAHAAVKKFKLDRVYFIPSGLPPHKRRNLAEFPHRVAMVALASADEPKFIPSTAEAGKDLTGRQIFYSVDTVRHFKRQFHGRAHLYFIVGADQFLTIREWRDYETLLGLCDFIVANRPGFQMNPLRRLIPPRLLAPGEARDAARDADVIALRHATIYSLTTVSSDVSATDIRRRVRNGKSIEGLVPPRVEEYIHKQALYR